MRLEDIDVADKLRTKLKNTEFWLQAIDLPIAVSLGDRGHIGQGFGASREVLSDESIERIRDEVRREIVRSRAEIIQSLTALGFTVEEPSP